MIEHLLKYTKEELTEQIAELAEKAVDYASCDEQMLDDTFIEIEQRIYAIRNCRIKSSEPDCPINVFDEDGELVDTILVDEDIENEDIDKRVKEEFGEGYTWKDA